MSLTSKIILAVAFGFFIAIVISATIIGFHWIRDWLHRSWDRDDG